MNLTHLAPGLALVLAPLAFAPASEITSPGRVSHVTLYLEQAMVTRTVAVEGPAGMFELIVPDLPEQVNPASMFAEGDAGLEVRAVEFRARAVSETPRDDIRQLEASMAELQQQISLNAKKVELAEKRTNYLDKLEAFVAPAAMTELTQGVLDAEALEKLSTFSFAQRDKVAEEQVELQAKKIELDKQLELATRKLAELTAGSTRTQREAVVYLQKDAAGAQQVRLNYLVNGCGWSPSYVLRATSGQPTVAVEYNGLIRQLSGEDWTTVELTLSTASPALSAAGPGLAPFRLTLAKPPTEAEANQQVAQSIELTAKDVYQRLESIRSRQSEGVRLNQNSVDFAGNASTSWNLNGAVNDLQCLELTADSSDVQAIRGGDARLAEGPSLSYRLESRVSLKSRSDQQMVRITNADLSSRLYHIATPLLTSYVYREAELTNNGREDLLNGPITVYLDGRFVGRSEIPTVARGQNFLVGLGADPQLRSRRELANRTDGVQGGNRELTFTYRLVIENFKEEATVVRVVDRLPNGDRESEIRVRVADLKDPLSEDKLYLRIERPQGILRWDVEAPAGATGESARLITYTYSVEYDRSFFLASPLSDDLLQQEFEQLQKKRNRY